MSTQKAQATPRLVIGQIVSKQSACLQPSYNYARRSQTSKLTNNPARFHPDGRRAWTNTEIGELLQAGISPDLFLNYTGSMTGNNLIVGFIYQLLEENNR